MVRLSIDFEFPSRTWWENGGQQLWDGIAEGFDGSHVLIDESLAESWLTQARAIEGWNEGHEYAPHPVRLSPLDADEEDLL
ncbi:MAG: hypothetical protein OEM49_13265 [Myxococcales bacterium]|nr:hypothetical protein [Myxococcales bacterium]MDH5308014.1 hypothetical protein [Myxococcales bacterium]MDH5568027.1 hypothetical protein [Myxococcales bacterium]